MVNKRCCPNVNEMERWRLMRPVSADVLLQIENVVTNFYVHACPEDIKRQVRREGIGGVSRIWIADIVGPDQTIVRRTQVVVQPLGSQRHPRSQHILSPGAGHPADMPLIGRTASGYAARAASRSWTGVHDGEVR